MSQLKALFTSWSDKYASNVLLVPMFGLHTAEGMVGSFGTAKRLKYGVVGEVCALLALLLSRATSSIVLPFSSWVWVSFCTSRAGSPCVQRLCRLAVLRHGAWRHGAFKRRVQDETR